MQNIQLSEMRTLIHVSTTYGDNDDFYHRGSVPLLANELEVPTQGKLLQHSYTYAHNTSPVNVTRDRIIY